MMRGETKKLFIIGVENTVKQIQNEFNIHPDSMLVLQIYGPVITDPYSDPIRDIILSVYEENVKEIYVVGTKRISTNDVNMQEVIGKIYDKEEIKEKIQTLDYLFRACKPEFPKASIREWLEGSKTVTDGVQKTVEMIQNHPLIPSDVNVYGIVMDELNANQLEPMRNIKS